MSPSKSRRCAKDVETYGRHARVTFTRDWASDARRRDFTMNALYAGPDGTVYDPLGGYDDLMARRVRFIGDPACAHPRRLSADTALLPLSRQSTALAMRRPPMMDAEALIAIAQESAGLEQLSGERVCTELLRLLAARGAALAAGDGGQGRARAPHRRRAAAHRLRRLRRRSLRPKTFGSPADPMARLAPFWPCASRRRRSGWRDALRLSNAERDELKALPRASRAFDMEMESRAARAVLYRLGARIYRAGVLLAWSQKRAQADDRRWRALFTLPDEWTPPEFPLGGADLLALGLQPGPEVGAVLRALEQRWIDGDFAADRDTLMDWARESIAAY